MLTVLLLLVGFALIIAGANYFTEGASFLAKRFGISEFIVGMTIVAIGTSMPELVVSTLSAIKGNSDMSIGNVVGSNMFNALFILAFSAIVAPIPLTRNIILKDLPFLILASGVCLVVAIDPLLGDGPLAVISRGEGIMLLGFFLIFMAYMIFSGQTAGRKVTIAEKKQRVIARRRSIWLTLLMIAGGCTALVFGADLFLDSSTAIARSLGVSEAVIAVTLVAAGTSMPELATSIVAAMKKNTDIAFGNIVGSNIVNIFLVLGTSATVRPLTMGDITTGDMVAMNAVSLLLFVLALASRKKQLARREGVIFLLLYGAYVWWLLVR